MNSVEKLSHKVPALDLRKEICKEKLLAIEYGFLIRTVNKPETMHIYHRSKHLAQYYPTLQPFSMEVRNCNYRLIVPLVSLLEFHFINVINRILYNRYVIQQCRLTQTHRCWSGLGLFC